MSFPNSAHNRLRRYCANQFLIALSIVLLFQPSSAGAEGFRIPYQSASATGQAEAFAGQADDPSAVHHNPAGMTQLNRIQLLVGASLVGGHVSFESTTGVSARGDLGSSIALPPPSNYEPRRENRD